MRANGGASGVASQAAGSSAPRADAETQPPTPNQTCTEAAQCANGFCVDGICCNEACTGTCVSCNQAQSPGTCLPVVDAEDPSASTPCTGTNICTVSADGQPACKLKSRQICSMNAECASGTCGSIFVPPDPADPYGVGYTYIGCEYRWPWRWPLSPRPAEADVVDVGGSDGRGSVDADTPILRDRLDGRCCRVRRCQLKSPVSVQYCATAGGLPDVWATLPDGARPAAPAAQPSAIPMSTRKDPFMSITSGPTVYQAVTPAIPRRRTRRGHGFSAALFFALEPARVEKPWWPLVTNIIVLTVDATSTDMELFQPERLVARPFLFLALEAERPLGGGARFGLTGTDEVLIGRGPRRQGTRARSGGKTQLTVTVNSAFLFVLACATARGAGRLDDRRSWLAQRRVRERPTGHARGSQPG